MEKINMTEASFKRSVIKKKNMNVWQGEVIVKSPLY